VANLLPPFSSSAENPSDTEVEILVALIAKYTLARHLFWGMWGIVSVSSIAQQQMLVIRNLNDFFIPSLRLQGHVNKNIDFEYREYARQRFHQYWQTKPRILQACNPTN
jgi:choline/ethanolamine kinase